MWFSRSGLHRSKLNPYEIGTGLTCSPVNAGMGSSHTPSFLELHVGLTKTPVQGGRAPPPAEVKQRLPAHLFALSFDLEQRLPRCYESSSHLLLLIHSISSPPLMQNLATVQEHSSSSESSPSCGQAEHWLGVNSEAVLCVSGP